MAREPKMTTQTLKVLFAIMRADRELCGTDVMRSTKLSSGTIYPILARCTSCGWLDGRWEDANAKFLERPLKRFYTITKTGRRKAIVAGKDLIASMK